MRWRTRDVGDEETKKGKMTKSRLAEDEDEDAKGKNEELYHIINKKRN